ncbi:MAG: hypothetical protein Aureis2KO_00520 [Aureisphaera sp.]
MSCKEEPHVIPTTTFSEEARKHFQHGLQYEGVLNITEAETEYRNALKLDPSFVKARLRLAMLRGNFEARQKHLDTAMQDLPKISKGEQLWLLGRNSFYGKKELGQKEEYDYFKELVSLYPEDHNANYLFGFVNIHHGRHEPDTAIRYFDRALQIKPNMANYYNELAYAHLAKGDIENAEKVVADYLRFLPNHIDPLEIKAEIEMRSHSYEASLASYNEVLKLDPDSPWTHIGVATNLSLLGRYDEARKALIPLGELKLSDYEYRHRWRAEVCSYLMEGDMDSAIVTLRSQQKQSLLESPPREPIFHRYITASRITRLYFEKGDWQSGMQSYKEWLDFVENNLTNQETIQNVRDMVVYFEAYSKLLQRLPDDAIELLEPLTFKTEDVKLLLARAQMEKQEYIAAIELLEGIDSQNAYYLYWLAKAYQGNGSIAQFHATLERIPSLIETNNLDYAIIQGPFSVLIEKN